MATKKAKTAPVPTGQGKPKGNGGRRTFELTPDLVKAIPRLLSRGRTDRDVCELSGISTAQYYLWLQTGRAMKGLEAMPGRAPKSAANRALCAEFTEAVTRARAEARALMIDAIIAAAEGLEGHEHTVETFTETRLNKNGEPYEYVRRTERDKTIDLAPNPSIALEYLARRDKGNWSSRTESVEVDFDAEVIKAIQTGEVTYSALLDEFKNEAQVLIWFKAAGVKPVTDEDGEAEDES